MAATTRRARILLPRRMSSSSSSSSPSSRRAAPSSTGKPRDAPSPTRAGGSWAVDLHLPLDRRLHVNLSPQRLFLSTRRLLPRVLTAPLLLLLLFFSALPGATATFYEAAPSSHDCFFIMPTMDQSIEGSFESFFGNDSLMVTLESPTKKLLFQSAKGADRFKVKAEGEARHAFCVRNLLSYAQTVTFFVHTRSEGGHVNPLDVATQDETKRLGDLASKMSEKVDELLDSQAHAITREAVYREVSENTNSRVLWWTFLEVLVLIVMSSFQLYYMRSFFEVKSII